MTRILPGARRPADVPRAERAPQAGEAAFDALLSAFAQSPLPMSAPGVEDAAARLLPWRLQAQAGLSYADLQVSMPAIATADARVVDAAPDASQRDGVSIHEDTVARRPLQPRLPAPDAHAAAVHAVPPVASGECAFESEGQAVAASTPASLSRPGGAPPFAPRNLHWQFDEDGLVAIARDFQLPAQAVPALVSLLRRTAADAGTTLRRVVVNGREAWRNAEPTPSEHKGA